MVASALTPKEKEQLNSLLRRLMRGFETDGDPQLHHASS
jgi:hypothetical protein